jgi:zinc transport system ATP-binding protein
MSAATPPTTPSATPPTTPSATPRRTPSAAARTTPSTATGTARPGTPATAQPPVISLRHAAFGYADRTIVAGVDLDIRTGETVALLGPNGSGKSTLVRGLLGLNDHLGGDVRLFGTPMEDFHEHARVGYVPQRHTLSASVRATVTEVVAIGRLPHRGWLSRQSHQDRAIIDEALELVGLEDRAQADVSTLSGGQQRRVLIARALAAQPDVLIMDEPTAGVDVASQRVLSGVLARLAARGTTMLIVTHELEALRGIVSRILVVTGGRLSFDGSAEELAAAQAALPGLDHGHHHDDEPGPGPHREVTPTAGPLDATKGGRRA